MVIGISPGVPLITGYQRYGCNYMLKSMRLIASISLKLSGTGNLLVSLQITTRKPHLWTCTHRLITGIVIVTREKVRHARLDFFIKEIQFELFYYYRSPGRGDGSVNYSYVLSARLCAFFEVIY